MALARRTGDRDGRRSWQDRLDERLDKIERRLSRIEGGIAVAAFILGLVLGPLIVQYVEHHPL